MGARGPVKGQMRPSAAKPGGPAAKRGKAPPMPGCLTGDAAAYWKAHAAALAADGRLTPADVETFVVCCQAWDDYLRHDADVKKNGDVQVADSGYESLRPAATLKGRAADALRIYGSLFGLNPLARTRSGAPDPAEADAANPLLEIMAQVQAARASHPSNRPAAER